MNTADVSTFDKHFVTFLFLGSDGKSTTVAHRWQRHIVQLPCMRVRRHHMRALCVLLSTTVDSMRFIMRASMPFYYASQRLLVVCSCLDIHTPTVKAVLAVAAFTTLPEAASKSWNDCAHQWNNKSSANAKGDNLHRNTRKRNFFEVAAQTADTSACETKNNSSWDASNGRCCRMPKHQSSLWGAHSKFFLR